MKDNLYSGDPGQINRGTAASSALETWGTDCAKSGQTLQDPSWGK